MTRVLSRGLGRKTRTGLPDFSASGVVVEDVAGFAMELGEGFRRARAGREAGRAVGRGFLFITAEDSERDLEGTIILRSRRATFPDAARLGNQSGHS
jgi:hypothetical protein